MIKLYLHLKRPGRVRGSWRFGIPHSAAGEVVPEMEQRGSDPILGRGVPTRLGRGNGGSARDGNFCSDYPRMKGRTSRGLYLESTLMGAAGPV